jgi:probable rRNA maturation factor
VPEGSRRAPRSARRLASIFFADEQDRPVDGESLRDLAGHVLVDQRVPSDMELNVLCVGLDAMSELNAHHMGGRGPTDVLAFPMDAPGESLPGEPSILGDVVLCPAVAARQAAEHGVTEHAELELLLVHGILHLLGHDHAEADERRVMFTLTDRLLADYRAAAS